MVKYSAFSYKKGNSILHKCPSWIKLLFLPILNVLFLCLPPYFAFGLIAIQFLTACVLHISFKEQFRDLKPVLYYASLLIFFQFFSSLRLVLMTLRKDNLSTHFLPPLQPKLEILCF